MMKEPIHSEKIIVKYKDSMILPRAKDYQKSGPQERGIETRKLKGDQTLALTIQNRYHRGSSIQTLEQELLLKTSKLESDNCRLHAILPDMVALGTMQSDLEILLVKESEQHSMCKDLYHGSPDKDVLKEEVRHDTLLSVETTQAGREGHLIPLSETAVPRNLSTKIDKRESVVETNPEQGLPAERIQGGDISDKDPNEANLENLDSVHEIELINEPITKPSPT